MFVKFFIHIFAKICVIIFIELFIKSIFRERRDNYVPEISALEDDQLLQVDAQVQSMIKAMDFDNKEALLENIKVDGGQ